MKRLDKITMYGHEWLVAATDGRTATLWMTEPFAAHIFDEDNNDYETSSLRKWLKKQEPAFNFGPEVIPSLSYAACGRYANCIGGLLFRANRANGGFAPRPLGLAFPRPLPGGELRW